MWEADACLISPAEGWGFGKLLCAGLKEFPLALGCCPCWLVSKQKKMPFSIYNYDIGIGIFLKTKLQFIYYAANGVAMQHNNRLTSEDNVNTNESIWNKQSLNCEVDLSFQFHNLTFMYTVKKKYRPV